MVGGILGIIVASPFMLVGFMGPPKEKKPKRRTGEG
jgi:hypothetical protein